MDDTAHKQLSALTVDCVLRALLIATVTNAIYSGKTTDTVSHVFGNASSH